jgi:hypothetical protein
MFQATLVYFSILLGKLLHKIAKEELKPSTKYIVLSKNILILFLAASLLYFNFETRTLLGIVMGFLIFKPLKNIYLPLGLATFTSFLTPFPLILLSLTLLLTLLHSSLSKFKSKEFLLTTLFFALPFLLLFIETLINKNSSLLLGLAAGSLLTHLWARSSAW